MKKRLFALILAAGISLVSWSALAKESERDLADAAVPKDAVFLSQETDDGHLDFKYWVEITQEMVEVSVVNGRILKIEKDAWQDEGSRQVTLTETDVLNIITQHYPGAQVGWIMLAESDGLSAYKAHFSTGEYYAEIKLHPESGKVLEVDLDFETMRLFKEGKATAPAQASTPASQPVQSTAASSSGSLLSESEARALVLARLENGSISYIRLTQDDGRQEYEGEAEDGNYEYEFELDAKTGSFTEWEKDKLRRAAETTSAPKSADTASAGQNSASASDELIGTSRAKEIALAKAGGGTVSYIKLDREDGRQVYEGEIIFGEYEYEFEIDAKSGSIRDWDKDRRDDD